MRALRYSIYILSLTLCWHCALDSNEVIDDTKPVFFIKGQWGTAAYDLNAGVADYYLFTDFAAGGPADDNRLLLTGTFAKTGCTAQCPLSVSFIFQNSESGNRADVARLLSTFAQYSYAAGLSTASRTYVRIELKDPDGTVWRSNEGSQPVGTSFFEVDNAEVYELNEKKQPTWRMSVDFSCQLYQNGEMRLLKGSGRIAVAHPR